MMQVKPFNPDEADRVAKHNIPDAVIQAVNEFLSSPEFALNGRVSFKQDALIKRVQELNPGLDRRTLFDQHFLDFEEMYRDAGWKVVYDKPGYHENYDAYFEISRSWWFDLQPKLHAFCREHQVPEAAWPELVKIIRSAKVREA